LPSWFGDHIAAAREGSPGDALEWTNISRDFLSPMYRFSIDMASLNASHSVPREPNFDLML
jgi:hypothetical protein